MHSTATTKVGAGYRELNEILERAARAGAVPVTDAQALGLQQRWTAALSARLDAAIEFAGNRPLTDAVAHAWHELAAEQPTLRRLLDTAEDSPVLTEARRAEHRILALAAGLAGLDDPAEVAAGRGLQYRNLIRTGVADLARRVLVPGRA